MPKRAYKLQVFKDAEATARAAAAAFVQLAGQAIGEHGRFTVALSGGSTPRKLYSLLANEPFRREVDWSCVQFFWGDERPVGPDDPQSNFRMARETLLEPLQIPKSNIHRMLAERPNRDEAAQLYQNEIAEVLGISALGEPPSLDLILLGLGPDGHTASLFPATSALLETRRWVVANRVIKLATERITMTPMIINRARNIHFLVVGPEKAEPLAEVLEGFIDTQRLPAQLIHPANGEAVWFVDEAAAAKLKKRQA